MTIPAPVIAVAADVLAEAYDWSTLYIDFTAAGAVGDAPLAPTKAGRCMEWLRRTNAKAPDDALVILGRLLHRLMEEALWETRRWEGLEYKVMLPHAEEQTKLRERMGAALANAGLSYVHGGHIDRIGTGIAVQQLDALVRRKNLAAIEAEFVTLAQRAATHPRDALSAAANIVEAVLGELTAAWNLTPPSKRTLNTLWATVKPALKADPAAMHDPDLAKVAGAMAAMVDGLQGLRDGKSRAHAMRPELARSYPIEAHHARLVVNAALALTVFLIEAWDAADKRKAEAR